jgi:hypothetical protein
VQSKYRAVKKEYEKFKAAYGNRLEGEWNDILMLTFQSGDDKYKRLDDKLNGFRRKMADARQ